MRIAHASEHFDESDIGFIHAVGFAARSGDGEVVSMHVTQGPAESHAPVRPAELLGRWGFASAQVTHRLYECTGHDEIADELIAACENVKPELLIMATHGRTGLSRVLIGGVAEAVARNIAVPSLLLPLGSPGLVDPRSGTLQLGRVLVLGGTQSDAQLGVDAASWFVSSVGEPRTPLSLMHVDDGSPAPRVEAPPGMSLELSVRTGSLKHAAASVMRELQPNLVVMVTHGHNELRDVLWSSHTERVLHETKLPLLWVPPSFGAMPRPTQDVAAFAAGRGSRAEDA